MNGEKIRKRIGYGMLVFIPPGLRAGLPTVTVAALRSAILAVGSVVDPGNEHEHPPVSEAAH